MSPRNSEIPLQISRCLRSSKPADVVSHTAGGIPASAGLSFAASSTTAVRILGYALRLCKSEVTVFLLINTGTYNRTAAALFAVGTPGITRSYVGGMDGSIKYEMADRTDNLGMDGVAALGK